MDNLFLKNTLFAILFAGGEPLELTKIADAAEADKQLCSLMLDEIKSELDTQNSGICLLKFDNRYQFATRPAYADAVGRMLEIRKNAPLSQAALEVLALVAYNQPVSRSFIDQVRGVDSSSPVSTLLAKNLIAEGERLDLPGKPVSFVTTDNFLRCFGISSTDELPSVHGFLDLDDEESAEKDE